VPVEGRSCDLCSQPAFFAENGTCALVSWGRAKKRSERVNWEEISEGVMPWLVRAKKPDVSAAEISCIILAWMRGGWCRRVIIGLGLMRIGIL